MTYTTDHILIRVQRYRDSAGLPTCAAAPGAWCQYLRTMRAGTLDVCALGKPGEILNRRGDGTGALEPGPSCPLWAGDRALDELARVSQEMGL